MRTNGSASGAVAPAAFDVVLSKPSTTATYVGVGFDPKSTILGKDFNVSGGLAVDHRASSDAVTALTLAGTSNVPAFVDLNGDNRLDLVVGEDAQRLEGIDEVAIGAGAPCRTAIGARPAPAAALAASAFEDGHLSTPASGCPRGRERGPQAP